MHSMVSEEIDLEFEKIHEQHLSGAGILEKNEALVILEGLKPSCAIRETITGFIGDEKGNVVWNRACGAYS